jgi:hypothetical protein
MNTEYNSIRSTRFRYSTLHFRACSWCEGKEEREKNLWAKMMKNRMQEISFVLFTLVVSCFTIHFRLATSLGGEIQRNWCALPSSLRRCSSANLNLPGVEPNPFANYTCWTLSLSLCAFVDNWLLPSLFIASATLLIRLCTLCVNNKSNNDNNDKNKNKNNKDDNASNVKMSEKGCIQYEAPSIALNLVSGVSLVLAGVLFAVADYGMSLGTYALIQRIVCWTSLVACGWAFLLGGGGKARAIALLVPRWHLATMYVSAGVWKLVGGFSSFGNGFRLRTISMMMPSLMDHVSAVNAENVPDLLWPLLATATIVLELSGVVLVFPATLLHARHRQLYIVACAAFIVGITLLHISVRLQMNIEFDSWMVLLGPLLFATTAQSHRLATSTSSERSLSSVSAAFRTLFFVIVCAWVTCGLVGAASAGIGYPFTSGPRFTEDYGDQSDLLVALTDLPASQLDTAVVDINALAFDDNDGNTLLLNGADMRRWIPDRRLAHSLNLWLMIAAWNDWSHAQQLARDIWLHAMCPFGNLPSHFCHESVLDDDFSSSSSSSRAAPSQKMISFFAAHYRTDLFRSTPFFLALPDYYHHQHLISIVL